MKKSGIFYTNEYKTIQRRIKRLINSQPDFLSPRTTSSTRATGDAIQEVLAEHFPKILGSACKEYSAKFARRAMADMAFKDKDDYYYIVDVKTHRKEIGFHMPNLTSVDRLARFYEDDSNYFVVLCLSYSITGTKVKAKTVHFVPIEFLSWGCLTIGALGWGQIQIASADKIQIEDRYSRRRWMIELCDRVLEFYPNEIAKTKERIVRFKKVRRYWVEKEET